jgi:hypothetical protein
MQDKPIRYHSEPIANFPQQLARINREINAYHYDSAFDAYWKRHQSFVS